MLTGRCHLLSSVKDIEGNLLLQDDSMLSWAGFQTKGATSAKDFEARYQSDLQEDIVKGGKH
jgi:hypothetical protein